VNPHQAAVDHSVHPAIDWFINLIATYGITTVIAAETVGLLAGWCAYGAARHHLARRRPRRADRDTCNAIWDLTNDREETP
jgi:hypothetical protein